MMRGGVFCLKMYAVITFQPDKHLTSLFFVLFIVNKFRLCFKYNNNKKKQL